MGKACFTQKPLTHSIYEARHMAEVAREMKVATQMGNQGTAGRSLREQAAIVKAGTLGTVKEVHVWTNRPIWPQGEGRPPEVEVPKHVHWDLWIRPRTVSLVRQRLSPVRVAWLLGFWHRRSLGDMACHTMNMPYMAIDLQNPVSVEAETSGHNKETYRTGRSSSTSSPATDKRPAVTMTWYDGKKLPPEDLFDGEKVNESGALLIGDKGKLYSPGDYAEKGPKLLGGIEKPEVEFEHSPGHFQEFIRAIKEGKPAMSNFADYSGPLAEIVLLGNLAVWSGKKVEWDAKNLIATNSPSLYPMIHPTYRDGYML